MTYRDHTELLADDLVDAMSDLQDNGYNDEDYLRIFDALGRIAALAIEYRDRHEENNDE